MNLNNLLYSPRGEYSGANSSSNNNEAERDKPGTTPEREEHKEEKPILQRIKDALQDWSNKDEADNQYDDTRV